MVYYTTICNTRYYNQSQTHSFVIMWTVPTLLGRIHFRFQYIKILFFQKHVLLKTKTLQYDGEEAAEPKYSYRKFRDDMKINMCNEEWNWNNLAIRFRRQEGLHSAVSSAIHWLWYRETFVNKLYMNYTITTITEFEIKALIVNLKSGIIRI